VSHRYFKKRFPNSPVRWCISARASRLTTNGFRRKRRF